MLADGAALVAARAEADGFERAERNPDRREQVVLVAANYGLEALEHEPVIAPEPERDGGEASPASHSTQITAAFRARLPRARTPDGDPDAQARLAAGMPLPSGEKLLAHLEARTRFFDERVLEAIAHGTRQIVTLGAGYDDRALRFRAPGVRYFELDLDAAQRDKARRLELLGAGAETLTLAAADFRTDDAAVVLARAGHDSTAATLFICEGLLIDLNLDVTVRLLEALRSRSCAPSRLAVSLATHRDGEDSAAVVVSANALREHSDEEPWQTILPAGAQIELLAQTGWSVELTDEHTRGMLLAIARPA